MYCCQIFLGQIQDEIEVSTFAMSASGARAQTHLFTIGGMQYCCWATLHQEIDRYANIDYDKGHCSICPRQVCTILELLSISVQYTNMNKPDTIIPSNSFNREREINNLVRRADFNNDAYVQEFGLTISNNMMEVRGRVLPPPKLQYGGRAAQVSNLAMAISLVSDLLY